MSDYYVNLIKNILTDEFHPDDIRYEVNGNLHIFRIKRYSDEPCVEVFYDKESGDVLVRTPLTQEFILTNVFNGKYRKEFEDTIRELEFLLSVIEPVTVNKYTVGLELVPVKYNNVDYAILYLYVKFNVDDLPDNFDNLLRVSVSSEDIISSVLQVKYSEYWKRLMDTIPYLIAFTSEVED